MIVGTIYALKCTCHDEPVRYIGKTKVGSMARYQDHIFLARNGGTAPAHRWILDHGTLNIESILVEEVEDIEPHALDVAEGEWIRYAGLQGLNLLNRRMPRFGGPDESLPPIVRPARTDALVGLL